MGLGKEDNELVRLKLEARLKGGFYVEPDSMLLFIIRIRGHPNLKSVKELIYKRGYGKLNKPRIALTTAVNLLARWQMDCFD
ncbi:putative ribosomal protein L30, ferredoxin [Rosa chinensis]|uniref:Putative ribosomal protein L30, ferredoxin n=1 Tax=Rosa chinensis TaxID=74649 RepID=A0A2P6QC59_ROSCH|nr:putative ribosomal protein L30, ferredoxin [Rosa chinensis]